MTSSLSTKSGILIGSLALVFAAILVQAQYNTYDSEANSELGKLVRNTAKLQAAQSRHNQQQQHQLSQTATRNLYNRQQPLQYAPSFNKRTNSQYGAQSESNNYGPVMGAASHGRRSASVNNEQNDDDDSPSYGPSKGFGSSFDSGNSNNGDSDENSNSEAQPMNLNQAASGYPSQGDYSEAGLAGYGQAGYGAEGSEFGPSGDEYGLGDGRRHRAASNLAGYGGYGSEEDAGASQYGPNSAVNSAASGGDDDEGRSAFAGDSSSDNNDDDE